MYIFHVYTINKAKENLNSFDYGNPFILITMNRKYLSNLLLWGEMLSIRYHKRQKRIP